MWAATIGHEKVPSNQAVSECRNLIDVNGHTRSGIEQKCSRDFPTARLPGCVGVAKNRYCFLDPVTPWWVPGSLNRRRTQPRSRHVMGNSAMHSRAPNCFRSCSCLHYDLWMLVCAHNVSFRAERWTVMEEFTREWKFEKWGVKTLTVANVYR